MAVIEEHGYFWWSTEAIPDGQFAPKNAVPGYLQIAENGTVKLELHGFLSESSHPLAALFLAESHEGKSIQGILKASNRNVLLLDIESDGGRASAGGISHQNFRAWRALVGNDRIECAQDLRISGLSVELDGFEDWLLLGAISGKRTRRSITVKAKLSNTHQYALRDSKLTIKTKLRHPFGNFKHKRKLVIEEHAQLEHSFKSDINLEQAQDKFLLVSDLLTLLSGSSRSLNWPRLHIGRGKSQKRYQYFYGSLRDLSEPANFFDCWVTFPQISGSFGNILQSWDDAQKKLGSGLQLFVGTLKSTTLHLEHKFANFIWGLEVLHRLKHPSAVQSEKFKEKIDRIINDVKLPKDRAWLNERLRNAHEPSLQQRLQDIIDSLGLDLEEKSLKDFCKVCADLRNDLSHFGGQRIFPNYDEMIQALHEKLGSLELLYHAITLKEIGIDNQIIKNFIFSGRHSYKFMQTMKRAGLTTN